MVLEVVLRPLSLDGRIALRPRVLQPHRLPCNLKTLDLLNRCFRRSHVIEDNEGLAFALQTAFRDDVDYGAEHAKDLLQAVDEVGDFDVLGEITDLGVVSITHDVQCVAM